jgi:hypothetical protein
VTDTPLQQRDVDVLEALCEDRAECGQGLTRAELEQVGGTRWPHHCLRRLREAGHRIASVGTGEEGERWQLLDPEVERSVSERRAAADQGSGPAPGRAVITQAGADAPLSPGKLFELPPAPHYDVRAAA